MPAGKKHKYNYKKLFFASGLRITAAISCGRSALRYILFQEKYLGIMTNSLNRNWLDA